MATHQGAYNMAREEGRNEVLSGLQKQDSVDQMVAVAREESGNQGFAEGKQSGANAVMDQLLQAQPQAGLGGSPQEQPQEFSEEDVMSVAQGLQTGEITEEVVAQIDAQSPGLIQEAVEFLEYHNSQNQGEPAPQEQAAPQGPQAGLSPQLV